jgi:ABC-type sugar transport system substrate-binding protein
MAGSGFVGCALGRRHTLDPGGCGQANGTEPAIPDVREVLCGDAGAGLSCQEAADAVHERRSLGDPVPQLRSRDLGAMVRIASRIHLAEGSSDEEPDGGQQEHDPYRCELTRSRVHVEAPAILPASKAPMCDGFPAGFGCASVASSSLDGPVKAWPIAIAAAAAIVLAANATGAAPGAVRMGVVLKGLDNPFFVAIYEGVRAEGRRRGTNTSVRAATNSADRRGQAALARALVAGGKDCYVVNPISATNLVDALRGARGPIVNVDSPIDAAAAKRAGVRIRTYVGTNDFAAGRLAGAKMASLLRGGGTVALIGGLPDSVNSKLRLTGFERGIRGTRVRVVARVDADYVRATAEVAAEGILHTHPQLSGFFAVNDLMALGVADAVRSAGKTGEIPIIGLDGIPEALDAVRDGSISATVSQYPYVMGRMAVEACVAAARGARTPARVDAPIAVVTKSNVARASATFPRPFRGYSDPFERILGKRR